MGLGLRPRQPVHVRFGSCKRHVGKLGLGGIYRIEYVGTTPVVKPIYTVPNVGVTVDRSTDLGAPGEPSQDTDAFSKVGKWAWAIWTS